MSKEQLVEEYASGRLRRKAFVRKLAALGISVASAWTYADRLAISWVVKAERANTPALTDTGLAGTTADDNHDDDGHSPNFYPA